jgi:hypothetical protein
MREIDPDLIAELGAPVLRPIYMARLFFDAQTVNVWSGYGDLLWDGNTYLGVGHLGGISPVGETQENQAKGIVVTLSAQQSDIALALNEKCRGRAFRLYLGALKDQDSSGVLVGNPYRLFAGIMDTMEITLGGDMMEIRLSVENAMIIGQRSKPRRYTSQDQRQYFPGDAGLDLINALKDASLTW